MTMISKYRVRVFIVLIANSSDSMLFFSVFLCAYRVVITV